MGFAREVPGQMLDSDRFCLTDVGCIFNNVLQFPHITGIGIVQQELFSLRREIDDLLPEAAGKDL